LASGAGTVTGVTAAGAAIDEVDAADWVSTVAAAVLTADLRELAVLFVAVAAGAVVASAVPEAESFCAVRVAELEAALLLAECLAVRPALLVGPASWLFETPPVPGAEPPSA
jgi:hypothetical protein